jgi:hypothetical protein
MNRLKTFGSKKLVAIFLVASLAIGSIFASPLNLASSTNDAKIYNETYKSVKDASSVSDGWIVRTKENMVSFENSGLSVTVGENSLVQFTSLDDQAPVIYLIDGWISVTTDTKLTIKTTVTGYAVNAGSSIVVISNAQNEHGYVEKGSATAVNAITNAITKIEEGNYLNLADSTAQTKAPETDSQVAEISTKLTQPVTEEPVVEESVTEQPAEEQQTETAEVETTTEVETTEEVVTEPEAETEVETVAETTEEAAGPLTKTFTYAGYEATVTAYIGQAVVEYPAFVTAQELYDAAQAAYNAYSNYLSDVYIQVVEDGKAIVTYPETYGVDEFNFAMDILEKEIPYYIATLFGLPVEEAPEVETETAETVEAQPAEIEINSEPAEPVTTTVIVPLTKTFSYAGYEATITANIGQATIEYPAFVTAQEIYDAATAAYNAYPSYLSDVYIQVVEDGKAVVTYPETYGQAEFNLAVSLIEKELPSYIASLFAEEEPEVYVDTTEAVIIEIVAPESPAVKAETAETAEVAEAPEVTVTAVKQEKKSSNVRLGATLGLVYGQYTEDSEFKAIIDKHYIRRIGISPENATVIFDPYITIDNFTFGLHFEIDAIKTESSYNSTSKAAKINSIAKYIGRINYNTENVSINIDRTHSVEFSSPVFYSMDKAFDKNDSLVATASAKFGFLKVSGFVDDLEFTNHLNGQTQYAGLTLTSGSKYVAVNASVLAAVNNLKDIDFYPSIDAHASFNIRNTKVTLYAGFAGLYKTKTTATTVKATFDFDVMDFSFGVAYNSGSHISGSISNSNVTVTEAFKGKSLDVLFSAGLHVGALSIDGSVTLPLSLNDEGGKIAYNTVKTASGSTKQVSADIMSLSAKLQFSNFSITGGVLYEGFAAKAVNVIKALKNDSGKRAAVKGLVDTDLATIYAKMALNIGGFEAYARGDFANIDGHARVAATFGASFSF